jgi:hypothetical protein
MAKFSRIALVFLAILLCFCDGNARTEPAGVSVGLLSLNPLRLHVVLRSGANGRVAINRDQLPWATRQSMVLAIVKADGQCLERVFPVEDGAVGRISLEPGESLSGEVDLNGIFRGLDDAIKRSDVHLFWAYQAPPELNIGTWSGGWVLLPREKTN